MAELITRTEGYGKYFGRYTYCSVMQLKQDGYPNFQASGSDESEALEEIINMVRTDQAERTRKELIEAAGPYLSIFKEVENEVLRAKSIHTQDYNSAHEAYAVILEEVQEMWEEIKKKKYDKVATRKEAIQAAGTILRFIKELL